MINQNQRELKTYEKPFKQRKEVGDRAENCFAEYLATKYDKSEITHRQKEIGIDFKLPDFVVKTKKNNVYEFEVKTTNKIKVRDYNYQLQHYLENKLEMYYIYVKILNSHRFRFRPIKIQNLLDYRVLFSDGVYKDSTPKAYFTVDWELKHGKDFEFDWIEFHSPYPIS